MDKRRSKKSSTKELTGHVISAVCDVLMSKIFYRFQQFLWKGGFVYHCGWEQLTVDAWFGNRHFDVVTEEQPIHDGLKKSTLQLSGT